MRDRIPVNPGRVLITPEDGSAAFYATMVRADNPTQEGTPLNKANLLKDATAALFGLGADAVPDDVLERIHDLIAGRAQVATGSYTGTGTYGASNPNSLTFDFVPKLVIVAKDGLHPGGYDTQWSSTSFIWTYGQTSADKYDGDSTSYIDFTQTGNKLSWYNKSSANGQCNTSGAAYHYVAIG